MRLLTRSDFDGLACGAILKELNMIDSWEFVHPKDLQDGTVRVTYNDILANVPYVSGCNLWFDHHSSESERIAFEFDYDGCSRPADSAARVIYDYYGGRAKMPHLEEMVKAVDKVDAAKLTSEEILHPKGWILLGFIMDPRTGLGRFRNFKISNYELMKVLLDVVRIMKIDDILALSDVKERVDLYFEQEIMFQNMLNKYTKIDGNLIITDLRDVETIYTGNRFLIYSLHPEQNISMWIVDGRGKQSCSIAVGHSIINRTSKTNVGALMLKYGGGGHNQVGTCQVPYDDANKTIEAITAKIRADG